jgi:tetratricopeptide (TPR) repeat protein
MRKIYLFLAVLLSANAFSQTLHSPAEILKIMEDSKLSYEINALSKPLECIDRSNNIVDQAYYRVKNDSSITTFTYNLKPEAKPFLDKAEKHFAQRNLDSARIYYEKVLEIDPAYYKVMTYIGQMYGSTGNLDKALEWYQKTIALNYIDYLAHWLMADIYRMQGKINEAVNEITIANVLNRNNPRLKKLQYELYDQAKLKTDDWCFNPQMEISSEGSKVKVAFDEVWIGYALPKAIWKYEPGYKESMGVKKDQYSTLEDKECLLNLLIALKNSKTNTKKYPDITNLKKAVDKGFINEYIIYEIVLPEKPFAASQLSEETINKIKDYILSVRYAK